MDEFNQSMVTLKDKSKEWGITKFCAWKLCKEGRVEGARIVDHVWLIPRDAKKPQRAKKTIKPRLMGYVTVSYKAKEWKMRHDKVKSLAIAGKIPGAMAQSSRLWIIPKLVKKPHKERIDTIWTYYDGMSQKAAQWGVRYETVGQWAKSGVIKDALEYNGRILIPKNARMPKKYVDVRKGKK